MADTTIFSLFEGAASDAPDAGSLSPRAKVFVIIALSLAAWVPVALPLVLLLNR